MREQVRKPVQKLMMLRGLPGSGKTTYAKKLVEDSNYKRVNKDELREMLDNGQWSKKNEDVILDTEDSLIRGYLELGFNVVVDDTNFGKHETRLRAIADDLKAEFIIRDFTDVPLEECIKRDAARARSVGRRVITKMYHRYVRPQVQYEHTPDLPHAIIVDIDGTVAHGINETRRPHEYDKVSSDTVDKEIRDIVVRYPNHVIFVSGRPESAREDTEQWLAWKAQIPYTHLFMRSEEHYKAGTKDYIVKHEIFDKFIKGKYNIDYVLDDRNQVVDEWRSMGLKVLQVADGDF